MTVPTKLPDVNIPDIGNLPGLQEQLKTKGGITKYLKQYPEIANYVKKKRLKKTSINITKATNALRAEKQFASLPLGKDISYTASDAPRQVIYGLDKVGGTITFIDVQSNNSRLDLVISLADHEIESVEKVYLDDAEVVFQSGSGFSASLLLPDGTSIPAVDKIYFTTGNGYIGTGCGTDSQDEIAGLSNVNTKWTDNHRQRGVARVYLGLYWDSYIYGDGIPGISFLVKGKKVRDPRTGLTVYSNNSALCAADYITTVKNGLKADVSKIDDDLLTIAADICDEDVTLAGGGTEKRYTTNCHFYNDESRGNLLEKFAAAMGGHILNVNGVWKIVAASWREPDYTITEDDIISPISMQTMAGRDEIFNAVQGVYVSSEKGYIETDYPLVKNDTYETSDGERILENIDYHFVRSSTQCQRLSKIEIERIRQGIQLKFMTTLRMYKIKTTDNVRLTISRYGWNEKLFEVVGCDLLELDLGGIPYAAVELSLRETAEAVFDWNDGEESGTDLAPNTDLPNPFSVPDISNLTLESGTAQLYTRADGTIFSRLKVSWDAIVDSFVTSGGHIEMQYKKHADSDWISTTEIPGSSSFSFILDVHDGVTYDVRTRAVSALGVAGDWVEELNYLVLGKTEKPSDIDSFASEINELGLLFSWDEITDLDRSFYEIRSGSSWASGSVIAQTRSNKHQIPPPASGSVTYYIKAVDTTGNYSTNADSITVTISAPGAVQQPTSQVLESNVLLAWRAPNSGSLALSHYLIYKGNTFLTASFLGRADATFKTYIEATAGTYTYWIVAVDIAGNVGTEVSVSAVVLSPNNFSLQLESDIVFEEGDVLTNIKVEGVTTNIADGGYFDLFQFLRGGV